jgi:ankyrin repeat protein
MGNGCSSKTAAATSKPSDANGKLFAACRDGDVNGVKQALTDANLDARDDDEQTPLIAACAAGSVNVVKLLLKKGANTHAEDSFGQRPFHAAARANAPDVMALFQHGPNSHNAAGNSSLHFAAAVSAVAAVEWLLEKHAHPDALNGKQVTPLMSACTATHKLADRTLLIARALIDAERRENGDRGAALLVNAVDAKGTTAAMRAAKHSSLAVLEYFRDETACNFRAKDKHGKACAQLATDDAVSAMCVAAAVRTPAKTPPTKTKFIKD